MADFLSGMVPPELLGQEAEPEGKGAKPLASNPYLDYLLHASASPSGIALDAGSPEGAKTLRFRLYRCREAFRRDSGSAALDSIIIRLKGQEVTLVREAPIVLRNL